MAQLANRQESEIKEREAQHADAVERMGEGEAHQLETLRKAYDVQISDQAASLDEKLHQIKMENEAKVNAEKRLGEDEVKRTQAQVHQRVEEYRKNGEAQIEQLKKQFQASTEALHERARKQAQKETNAT